jgi:hypothetical protein
MTEKNQSTDPSRWEILARERNARVVLCHTPDTYTLTELTRSADRAIRVLRDRSFTTLSIEAVTPLFQEYNDTIIRFHEVIQKICDLVDINYKPPRTISRMVQYQQNGNPDDATKVEEGEAPKNKKKSAPLS